MAGRRSLRSISLAVVVAAVVAVGATAASGSASAPPSSTTGAGAWTVRPGIHQVSIEGGVPGTPVRLLDASGTESGRGDIDLLGSLLFRVVSDGTYTLASDVATSAPFTVLTPADGPDQSFYDDQDIEPGFGYITMRDGTTLSAWVSLPGDPADGPYPTLVEYSGYGPSNPSSVGFPQLINALGYAYVGVNMRGTGCSGGSYSFFDEPQVVRRLRRDRGGRRAAVGAGPPSRHGGRLATPASASCSSPRPGRRTSPRSPRSR